MLKSKLRQLVRSQSEPDQIVALDIGTENIKALIVELGNDSKLKVVGAGTAKQGFNDMKAGAIADIGAVVANCDKALSEAEKEAQVRGSQVVIGIAGELIKGITYSLKHKRQDSVKPLDIEELDEIIKRVQATSYSQAREELSLELGNDEIDLKLVNSALVGVTVDGYKVTNPVGFQGKEVEVQLYTAFAPLVHIGAIERVAADLDLRVLSIAAEPFAVARSVVGDDPNASLNAILIDVGGGTTDIAVIRDGGLEGTRMFGIGGRSFTNSVARELNISFEQAEKQKLAYSGGDEGKNHKAIEKALSKTADVWIQGVHLALAEFDWLDYLPDKILLCGGGSNLQLVKDNLADESWQKGLAFSKIAKPQLISVSDVKDIADTTGKVLDHTMITVLGLARVGNDTGVHHPHETSLKSKLNRVLEN